MKTKNIFSLVVLGVFFILTLYFGGIIGGIEFIISIFIYSIIFFGFYKFWYFIRRKQSNSYKTYLFYFLHRISILLLILVTILGSLTYYFNEVSPAKMPTYTISNGEKTVIFQAMSHIGTHEFYSQIVQDITDAKNDGYVYFFEGVKPGTPENTEAFDQAMGIKFDKDLYKNFSKLYGVEYQNNEDFLGLINQQDYNVDLGIDEIMEYYKQIEQKNSKTIDMPLDANAHIIDTLAQLNERQLQVLVYINQAILNFIIQSEGTQSFLTQNFANQQLFEVILGKRNEVLSQGIIKSQYDKIYVTYGLLHFKGVFEILQANDPNWKIIDTKYLYPIQ